MPKWIFQKISGDQQGESLWKILFSGVISFIVWIEETRFNVFKALQTPFAETKKMQPGQIFVNGSPSCGHL